MGLRDAFRRSAPKSVMTSYSDSTVQAESSPVSSAASSTMESPSGLSKLAKSLTWRSNKSSDSVDEKKSKKNKNRPILHPSERPFTETNLRHQEMLSQFTMTFGRSDPLRGSFASGVSPCTSRQCSIDASSSVGGYYQ